MTGNSGALTQPITGAGTQAQQCGSLIAQSSAASSESTAKALSGFVSNSVKDNLDTVLGTSMSELSSSLSRLLDTNSETINRVRRANLYNEWLTASQEFDTARARVIATARQNSQATDPTLTDFQNNYMHPDISANVNQIYETVSNYLIDVSNNFNTIYSIYNESQKNYDIVNNMLEMKEKILYDTIGNIQLYEKKNNVDIRKNLYDFERNSFYNSIFDILKILYYALFVIYIIFGNFMKSELYKNTYFYIVAVIYLILPFILKYIFAGIIYIYEYILKLLGMSETIYTYGDIVRASNIENIYTGPIPSIINRNDIENGYRLFVQDPKNASLQFI